MHNNQRSLLYSLVIRELNSFKSRLSINYTGIENIASVQYSKTIYTVNHPSYIDIFLVLPSLDANIINKNQFGMPATDWIQQKFPKLNYVKFFDKMGISFVGDNKEKNKTALKRLEEQLVDYGHIIIFPEGSIQRNGELRMGMYGTSAIALNCSKKEDVLILPIGLTYFDKPEPLIKKKRHWWSFICDLWNIDELILDYAIQAKQYYNMDIDVNFGKPISTHKLLQEADSLDTASKRRYITQNMMQDLGMLTTINTNHLLAHYLSHNYNQNNFEYGKDKLYSDISNIALIAKEKGYHVKDQFKNDKSLEQTLLLFEQKNILIKTSNKGLEKYVIGDSCKEYFETKPNANDEEFKKKNFLLYTSNQIAHLTEVKEIVEQIADKRG